MPHRTGRSGVRAIRCRRVERPLGRLSMPDSRIWRERDPSFSFETRLARVPNKTWCVSGIPCPLEQIRLRTCEGNCFGKAPQRFAYSCRRVGAGI
jgi:hypothetical protein